MSCEERLDRERSAREFFERKADQRHEEVWRLHAALREVEAARTLEEARDAAARGLLAVFAAP